jgi:hypothetical protein
MPMKALRLLAAFSLAATALLAGARAGGARAHHRVAATAPGTYPGAGDAIPVGEGVEVAGQPMRLSLFSTADAPARVAQFYADAFRARGLTPILAVDSGPAHVAVFDPADSVQRFVTAVPQPGGGTLVMSGSMDARRPPRFDGDAERASFPVPVEHRSYLAFRSVDLGSSAESAQFVTPLSAPEVAAFYRSTLVANGYSEAGDSPGEGMVNFVKGGLTISVATRSRGETSGTAVFVTRSEGLSR